MKVKKVKEYETTICDKCGKGLMFAEVYVCSNCRKDLCEDCVCLVEYRTKSGRVVQCMCRSHVERLDNLERMVTDESKRSPSKAGS